MNKVLLIIQREYLSRVRKKAFLVMTLLVPALVLIMYTVMKYLYKNSDEMSTARVVRVIDESGVFYNHFTGKKNLHFEKSTATLAQTKAELKKNEDEFALYIPKDYQKPDAIQLYSTGKPNLNTSLAIESQVNSIATNYNMMQAGIDTNKLRLAKTNYAVAAKQITETGEENSSSTTSYIVGVAGAILIYMSLFLYGAQVMRGVIEEKTNRIIEVIVSSVKPFQLMLGKIIGVGLVGITQFVLWVILSLGVTYLLGHDYKGPQSPMMYLMSNLSAIHFGSIIGYFFFYFITGFMLYSAIFAAVGSAVDSETETQQFMFPITLPLLFTYILSVSFLVQNPDSPLAVWLSVIPFTAPVAMMVRLPFHVPEWQIFLSMALMVVGFLFTTWVAARIYRVGILMYGKKASYGELAKWFFYKE
ncbi:ABC transporter permease [Mucilaginibacter koreensis]